MSAIVRPLQHTILALLSTGPKHFGELCESLAPRFSNRKSINAALMAMRYAGKVRTCGFYQVGRMGALAIWEIAPQATNALGDAWPMPVALPVGSAPRVHEAGL